MASLIEKSSLLFLFFFFLLVSPPLTTTAEIINIELSADSRPLILLDRFGFSSRGSLSLSLSEVTFSSSLSVPDPSNLGFLLLPNSNLLQTLTPNPITDPCILASPYVRLLLTLRELTPPPFNSFNRTFPVRFPDEYALFFANCAPDATPVSMSVRVESYNSRPDGSADYLSVGESPIPTIYSLASLVYLSFLSLWLYLVNSRRPAHRIHLLMAGLLLAKTMNLVLAAEDRHHVRTYGTSRGWDVLSYLFQLIKGVLLFTVIALIGTGWSFLKPFLQDREKKVLMVVVPLQVVTNVASVAFGGTGPFAQDRLALRHAFVMVDFVCCFLILSPVVWSIRRLRETSKADGKAARNLARLLAFRKFYIVVIGYLYFTRVVVLAIRTIASYEYRWVSVVVEEAVGLAFYVFLFYVFRPKEKNEYFVLDDIDEEAAMVALREEGFEL